MLCFLFHRDSNDYHQYELQHGMTTVDSLLIKPATHAIALNAPIHRAPQQSFALLRVPVRVMTADRWSWKRPTDSGKCFDSKVHSHPGPGWKVSLQTSPSELKRREGKTSTSAHARSSACLRMPLTKSWCFLTKKRCVHFQPWDWPQLHPPTAFGTGFSILFRRLVARH